MQRDSLADGFQTANVLKLSNGCQDMEAGEASDTQHLVNGNGSEVMGSQVTDNQIIRPENKKSQLKQTLKGETKFSPDMDSQLTSDLESRKLILKQLSIGTENCKVDVSHIHISKDFLLITKQVEELGQDRGQVGQSVTHLRPKHLPAN